MKTSSADMRPAYPAHRALGTASPLRGGRTRASRRRACSRPTPVPRGANPSDALPCEVRACGGAPGPSTPTSGHVAPPTRAYARATATSARAAPGPPHPDRSEQRDRRRACEGDDAHLGVVEIRGSPTRLGQWWLPWWFRGAPCPAPGASGPAKPGVPGSPRSSAGATSRGRREPPGATRGAAGRHRRATPGRPPEGARGSRMPRGAIGGRWPTLRGAGALPVAGAAHGERCRRSAIPRSTSSAHCRRAFRRRRALRAASGSGAPSRRSPRARRTAIAARAPPRATAARRASPSSGSGRDAAGAPALPGAGSSRGRAGCAPGP